MSSGSLSIRPFVRDDQAMVRRLILGGLGEHFGFIDEARNPDLDDISLHYLAVGDYFIVAERGDEIVGTGALVARDGNTGQIVRVSVSPTYRREGIGAALVSQLLGEARARGFSQVLVETNLDWHDAIRLYVRAGFVEYARDAESVYLARDLVDCDHQTGA
ncbi:MAG TPA: GNAT family N-acetyltransferase [Ktedonobacterales bacterium]